MELSSSNIKKNAYISGNETLHFPAQVQKNQKKFTPKKIPYISGNGTFQL